jgi:hypothetical protein
VIIHKLLVEIENGRVHAGPVNTVVATVRVKAWDAPDFCFRQIIDLDSFETEFDRFIEIARRGIMAEVERTKADQMPFGADLDRALDIMKKRNETGDQGVTGA